MHKSRLISGLMVILGAMLVFACAPTKPPAEFAPVDLNADVEACKLVKKVDGFMVLLDASNSMGNHYKEKAKFDAAYHFLHLMNDTLPDLEITAGYRTVGHNLAQSIRTVEALRPTAGIYGPVPYDREAYDKALGGIREGGGYSHLDLGIDMVNQDLRESAGQQALIVLSDGEGMGVEPVLAARRLKQQYGERICIYAVHFGNHPAGETLMRNLAAEGGCGLYINADQVISGADMAVFVERVFLTRMDLDCDGDGVPDKDDKCPDTPKGVAVDAKGCPLDGDGDGVPDYLDQCPNTPAGVQVDANGCALDADGDGVPDYLDQCPNTPAGVQVDGDGCALDADGDGVPDYLDQCPDTPAGARVNSVGCWSLSDVLFDYKKATIKTSMRPYVDEVVQVLKKNPGMKIEIQGHTDNIGSRKYNQWLSRQRARAIERYLVQKGIAADRLTVEAYDFSRPVASNSTEEGRAKNRRVEFRVQ